MSLLFLSLLAFLTSAFIAQASVSSSNTFKLTNTGELGPYIVEYDGSYRAISLFTSPFQLCFYNTTPNAYTLALRMATLRSESLFRWVWEANRGNPVGENATLVFGTNGNLVLTDSDGRIAWQTNTANKGVVDLKLLPNGNIVLHDSKGKFIWQSFDYPTDTLLVGQTLRFDGPVTKLVSRASATVNSNGPYSLEMGPNGLALYYKNKNSPKPYPYYSYSERIGKGSSSIQNLTFDASPDTSGYAYEPTLRYQMVNSSNGGYFTLGRPKYNATLTILRLGIDGNVKLYTYNDNVYWGAWENTYSLFLKDVREDECGLPERCGNFGLCEDSQCVACPMPNGLLGWSKDCEPKKLSGCGKNDFYYYKVEGVDHYMSKYTKGNNIKESECMNKCSKDCKCLGYFYNQSTSRCWVAYDLKTLTKVANSTHVGYIKAPKS